MTSIFSGQLYNNFLKDNNYYRLETYDVNRFQRTIEQMSNQGLAEKELREGLEYQQAKMADMQSKLNELIEKLNNLYRRFIDNKSVFRKVSQEPEYFGTSATLNVLQNINANPDTNGYPTGGAGITSDDDYDKIRNYSWNPFFGSKAIDESDKTVNRTFWEEPNEILEQAYTENGAFWSTVSYLWGWDLDRINATYATTSNNNNVQINVTALQPNKPQYPPMKAGDRFPVYTGAIANYPGYPAINMSGVRPGGVDYSHASDTVNTGGDSTAIFQTANIMAPSGNGSPGNPFFVDDGSFLAVNDPIVVGGTTGLVNREIVTLTPAPIAGFPNRFAVTTDGWNPYGAPISSGTITKQTGGSSSRANFNVVGENALNFGWEFDDLPMALEVVAVDTRPDGTTVPTQYKMVYDIPPTHPHYASLQVLNGTEPQILDAPTAISRDRIANDGFDYSAYTYIPGAQSGSIRYAAGGTHNTGGSPWKDNTTENELAPPKLYTSGTVIGPSYNTLGGADLGTSGSPITLSPADRSLFGAGSSLELVPQGINTTVSKVQWNTTTTRNDTGSGQGASEITTNDDLSGIDVGDYVKFSTTGGVFIYQINSITSVGFSVTPTNGGPVNPVTVGGAGQTIFNYGTDSTATTLKYANEGLVVVAPSGTDVVQVKKPDTVGATTPIMSFTLTACSDLTITAATMVNMKYAFRVHQNHRQFASPGDDPEIAQPSHSHNNHDWTSLPADVDYTGGGVSTGNFAHAMPAYTYLSNSPMAAGPVVLGQSDVVNSMATDAWIFGIRESVSAQIVPGALPNEAVINVYFNGDINGFEMNIEDVQLVTYDGTMGTWTQGKYDPGNVVPSISNGDPDVLKANSPDEVINKYIPGVYQFTQFNDQYNLLHTSGDRNDIVRSPWEFAELDLGANSTLSGEYWVDINSRRINLDHDPLQATTDGWGNTTVGVSNTGFNLTTTAVNNAHDFVAVVHPADYCAPGDESYVMRDSDPLSALAERYDTQDDEVMQGEAHQNSTTLALDPLRTANPGAVITPNYYSLNATPPPVFSPVPNAMIGGASNDATNTVDRIGAALKSSDPAGTPRLDYDLTIPTTDVNLVRNENNVLMNLGSIERRDMAINITSADMYVRTVPGYTTVPRYRVDPGGNVFDLFGKGFYDPLNTADANSINRVYTTSGGATKNGQVSNFDQPTNGAFNAAYNTTYAAAGSFEAYVNNHDRLSMAGDDYNLFDYVPDLNLVPGDGEGRRFGESYVGALPSNFYYYREELDNSVDAAGGANVPTGNAAALGGPKNFNNDGMGSINFDGAKTNLDGSYTGSHTYVNNPNMPAFANVSLGYVEQNAKMFNTARTTTQAVWLGFPGLGGETKYAENVTGSTNVSNPVNALGNNTAVAAMNFPTSQIILAMGQEVNRGGTLILNEINSLGNVDPHTIPLPLLNYSGTFPDFDDPDDPADPTPTTFTFNAYGAETVTRTGSEYMSFAGVIDAVDDGLMNGSNNNTTGMAQLAAAGGVFAAGDPAGLPTTWPNGVLLHVDNAESFDMTYPKNIVTLGTDATEYRVVYRNKDSRPQTLFLIPNGGPAITNTLGSAATVANFVHADLQVRAKTGQYTVQVTNAAGVADAHGSHVRIDYTDLGTEQPGQLASVGISSDYDRVGRIAGDDPRTTAVENNRIAPELFRSPHGYVQPDAQVALNLVAQDVDGNTRPRRLKSVTVEVESGEQLIPSALTQTYSTTGNAGVFSYNDGAGHWPIALFEEDTQINPAVTNDLNYFVGLYQGITAFNATAATPTVTVTSNFGLSIGQKVTINGEKRVIANIAGNVITLDSPLSVEPKIGDTINVGNGLGTQDIQMYLNRSVAMSMGAGMKVTLEWDEYDVIGFPPTVDTTAANIVPITETIGFDNASPNSELQIASTNVGTTTITLTQPLTAAQAAQFPNGTEVNVNGITRVLTAAAVAGGTTLTVDRPVETSLGQPLKSGSISQINYENFLAVGEGRSGGSKENEFTQELKRIIDNPEYKEILKYGLIKNITISASSNDQFNNLVSSKILLDWDRIRKQIQIQQTSFMAYFKSV